MSTYLFDDLVVEAPASTKDGEDWADPRPGAAPLKTDEPWSPTHVNSMSGVWRPPVRRSTRRGASGTEVDTWIKRSYPAWLVRRFLKARKSSLTLAFYRAATRTGFWSYRDLERLCSFRDCIPEAEFIMTEEAFLSPKVTSKLRTGLERLRDVKTLPLRLNPDFLKVARLKGAMSDKALDASCKCSGLSAEFLVGKLSRSLEKAGGYFHRKEDALEALRELYAVSRAASPEQISEWEPFLDDVAFAVDGAVAVSEEGLSIMKSIIRRRALGWRAGLHFSAMVGFVEGCSAYNRTEMAA